MGLIKYAICLLLARGACAQEFRSSILGRVTDSTGAVVPGVSVTVINVDTNVPVTARTNEQGKYRVPFLLPGNYRVNVEHSGFRRIERQGVRVSLGSDVTLDFELELAAAGESITVTASASLVSTTNADLGQVIEQTYIQNVPVSLTRNVLNRAYLNPGITYSDTTGTVTSNAQTQIVITGGGGARGRNEIIVDGIPNTLARSYGIAIFVPSQDSVEEMRVQTTLFDATYGHSNGGAINISTRGGTNEVHGTAYDFKRWRALNANSWVNNRKGLAKPPVNYNQFGAVIGGPVWLPRLYNGRNRTFFSFSLENNADKAPRTRQAHVPTELERAGDFSQTRNSIDTGLVAIYNPWSTVGSGTSARRTVFTDGRIPASLLNPTGVALAKAFPLPTENTTPQIGITNWSGTGVYQVLEKQFSARIDHQVSSRQRMFGRYSRLTRGDEFIPVFFPGVFNFPVDGQNDLGIQDRYFNSAALDDTISFTPTFAGSLRYGLVTRCLPKLIGVSSGRNLADPSGLSLAPIILSNQATKAFPSVTLGENFPGLGGRKDVEAWLSHAALATFYKTVSNHNLRFGLDYRMTRWNRIYLGDPQSGRFTFTPVFTQSNAATNSAARTSGSGLASLLLGVPTSGSLGYESPESLQNHYLALFVQEDWRVRRRLTLNFGLRWELETPYTERYNRIGYGFDYNAPSPLTVPGLDLRGGLLFAGINGNPRTEGNLDKNNFGPRFGFAWSLNDKTVVRGGYGLFFAAQTYSSAFQGSVATFDAVTNYVPSFDNNDTPATTLTNPFPYGLRPALGTVPGLAARYGDNLTVSDQYRVNPYTQQWQFGIQREFPGRILAEAAYVGALTLKSPEQTFDLNDMPDAYRKLGGAENDLVDNPFLGIFDAMSLLGKGDTIPQGRLWKRYPQYAASLLWGTSLSLEGAPTGRAVFHALESRVEKRFSHGLNVNWAYTFSKLITSNTSSIINERHYRSVGQFDVKHTTRMAFVYELPFGPRRPLASSLTGFLARLAEGWTVSGFLSANTGTPLSITDGTLASGAAGRPIRLRNAAKSGPISQRVDAYFDTTAFFRLPNQYEISPEPLYFDELRGPGLVSFNAAVTKDVRVVERFRLQLRGESADVTNSPIWANPLTNIATSATFGKIQDGGTGRSLQIGLKLTF